MARPSASAALLLALQLLAAAPRAARATMGPLVADTTVLDGCSPSLNPGDNHTNCEDAGVTADAAACAAACEARGACSAVTWHDAQQGEWAGHCAMRKDNITVLRDCGSGCGHTSCAKTSGWVPPPPPPPPPRLVWPPLAAGWTGFVKAMWFGANSSGLDSDDTLALMARHAIAGYGWQQGHEGGGSPGREEALLAAAATHARDYFSRVNASTVLFVYRQIQVCCSMFAQCYFANSAPSCAGFWLTDADDPSKRCVTSQPWGTQDAIWDWRADGATDWWVSNVIAELASESALTNAGGVPGAVFFDECDQNNCGYSGSACDFSHFSSAQMQAQQAASNEMLARTAAALNANNIIPIFSFDNRLNASGAGLPGAVAPCALPEEASLAALNASTWVRFYENWPSTFWRPDNADLHAAMIENAILETAAGVPVILHAGGNCPAANRTIARPGRLGGDVEFQVATYLIVADAGTTLSLSNDWYDVSLRLRIGVAPPGRPFLRFAHVPSRTPLTRRRTFAGAPSWTWTWGRRSGPRRARVCTRGRATSRAQTWPSM
jgi:hypothetical protein